MVEEQVVVVFWRKNYRQKVDLQEEVMNFVYVMRTEKDDDGEAFLSIFDVVRQHVHAVQESQRVPMVVGVLYTTRDIPLRVYGSN